MGSHQAVPHSTTLLCHPTQASWDSPHTARGRPAGLTATLSVLPRDRDLGTMLQPEQTSSYLLWSWSWRSRPRRARRRPQHLRRHPCRATAARYGQPPLRAKRLPAGSASWPRPSTPARARAGCGRPPSGWASTATPSKLPSASRACRRRCGGWAGSPAGSSPTAPRPNGPLRWPSGWAVSSPPRRSWARPGRRCAKPSVATASACRPATLRSCASEPLPSPASGMGGRPFQAWIRSS
jgi:hypothetical protein